MSKSRRFADCRKLLPSLAVSWQLSGSVVSRIRFAKSGFQTSGLLKRTPANLPKSRSAV
jgi:hypothetical protein